MSEIADAFVRLCREYEKPVDQERLAEWKIALSEWEGKGILSMAVDDLIRSQRWMPKASEVGLTAKRIAAESSDAPHHEDHHKSYSYACRNCQDTGLRTVWHPRAMRAAIDLAAGLIGQQEFRAASVECVVRCTCEAGDRRRIRKHQEWIKPDEHDGLVFRDGLMVEIDKAKQLKDQLEELAEWGRNWQPANYVSEFEEF